MNIDLQQIKTGFAGEYCYTHARGAMLPDGKVVITSQPLLLSGCDVFYGMENFISTDGGKTFAPPVRSATLVRRQIGENAELVFCDATPFFHRATGKLIITGHSACYLNNQLMPPPRPRHTVWSVWDEQNNDWLPYQYVDMPDKEAYFSCGSGCSQIHELPDGDLLIPVSFAGREELCRKDFGYHAMVMRCGFDGRNITLKELGKSLSLNIPRGLGEASIVKFGNQFLLALRNDQSGYVTRGDGLNFEPITPLCFDDGSNAGNYNTQQHWITGGGKLYLVYTRRGANNDHVFRHRAPLFIAQFDPEKMCLIRETERIAVPERGARLGNFGCLNISDKEAWVIVSEWMQTTGPDPRDYRRCMSYGSDNSIFIAKITF